MIDTASARELTPNRLANVRPGRRSCIKTDSIAGALSRSEGGFGHGRKSAHILSRRARNNQAGRYLNFRRRLRIGVDTTISEIARNAVRRNALWVPVSQH